MTVAAMGSSTAPANFAAGQALSTNGAGETASALGGWQMVFAQLLKTTSAHEALPVPAEAKDVERHEAAIPQGEAAIPQDQAAIAQDQRVIAPALPQAPKLPAPKGAPKVGVTPDRHAACSDSVRNTQTPQKGASGTAAAQRIARVTQEPPLPQASEVSVKESAAATSSTGKKVPGTTEVESPRKDEPGTRKPHEIDAAEAARMFVVPAGALQSPTPALQPTEQTPPAPAAERENADTAALASTPARPAWQTAPVAHTDEAIHARGAQLEAATDPVAEPAAVADIPAKQDLRAEAFERRLADPSPTPRQIEARNVPPAPIREPDLVLPQKQQEVAAGKTTPPVATQPIATAAKLQFVAAGSDAARVEKRARFAQPSASEPAQGAAHVAAQVMNAMQSSSPQPGVNGKALAPYAAPLTSEIAAEPRDAFLTIDRGSLSPATTWTHTGAHRAEAGYLDPSLGWISVRAENHGTIVQASLMSGNTLAAAELGAHVPALNTHLEQSGLAANVMLGSLDAGAGGGQQGSAREEQPFPSAPLANKGSDQPPTRSSGNQEPKMTRAWTNGNLISVVA